nr:RNA-directed DNA polymerase, eukaryota, reverse transcriptase zinc-binding domain protein [Tanacetum cinerariifolium]
MFQWIMECVTTAAFTLNVNGKRVGYFKGGRGLRQGDPMSPYLFTLIIEVFALIMYRQIAKELKFQYHFGCKEILLSHVCFVDDLLVMCHGDKVYVKVIKKILQEFSSCSDLLSNNAKSSTFFGSIKEVDKNFITSVLPFSIGIFPVKYLGVPLIAKILGIKECGCLLDKIKDGEIDKIVWKTSSGKEGNQAVSRCCLCFKESGDLQHLFFQCPLSKNVWSQAKKMADIKGNEFDWDEIVQFLISVGNGNIIKSVTRRLIFAASVYSIWQERNKRIFKDVMNSSEEVYTQITEIVRNKLLGIKVKNSSAVRIVESRWSISLNKLYRVFGTTDVFEIELGSSRGRITLSSEILEDIG